MRDAKNFINIPDQLNCYIYIQKLNLQFHPSPSILEIISTNIIPAVYFIKFGYLLFTPKKCM
ncbi:hypothetical protein GcC1_147018 [Golovinomyces cichoracearum]|uniref:Uncharacterized protein n=1 Tax=Golovinomyces cichoracearum TaxID=62708 RepID=A0A420HYD8_9PEZI|nr:hypothetical protein GcC1_147018 [Golovinomyces cichoracearum]